MQRAGTVEQQFEMRHEARVLRVQAVLAALPRHDVAETVEQREHVVALEGLRLFLEARRRGQHIPAPLDLDAIGFLQALIGHQIGDAVSVDSEGGAVVETSAPCNVLYTAR